jgi:hypothetical protein
MILFITTAVETSNPTFVYALTLNVRYMNAEFGEGMGMIVVSWESRTQWIFICICK